MPRGRRTGPEIAILARVLVDTGFESGLVSELVGLPRATVNDIARGRNGWDRVRQGETFKQIEARVKAVVERHALDLTEKVMSKLGEKISQASITEALNIYQALTKTLI